MPSRCLPPSPVQLDEYDGSLACSNGQAAGTCSGETACGAQYDPDSTRCQLPELLPRRVASIPSISEASVISWDHRPCHKPDHRSTRNHHLIPSIPACLRPRNHDTLHSTGFYLLHHYYAVVQLLTAHRILSIYNTSIPLTTLAETVRPPKYACNPSCARHALLTLTESPRTCLAPDSCRLLL